MHKPKHRVNYKNNKSSAMNKKINKFKQNLKKIYRQYNKLIFNQYINRT